MARTHKDSPKFVKTRSEGAIAAHLRPGAGAHGGGKRQRNRRDRQNAKLDLRSYA